MTTHKLASEIQPGDIVIRDEDDKQLMVRAIARGAIRGYLSFTFWDGSFSEVPPDTRLEIVDQKESKDGIATGMAKVDKLRNRKPW